MDYKSELDNDTGFKLVESKSKTKLSKSENNNKSTENSKNVGANNHQSTTPRSQINSDVNKHHVTKVKSLIEKNVKCLVILRGCSGSGKSTLASEIKFDGVIASADSYFINHKGEYKFDKDKLTEAHKHSKKTAEEAAKSGISPIIIDNTNIKIWEFKEYIKIAVKYEYQVEIMEPETQWRNKARILYEKNVHNVPYETIQRTLENFEKNVDLQKLIQECKKELSSNQTQPIINPPSQTSILMPHSVSQSTISSVSSSSNSPPRPKANLQFISNYNDYFNSSTPDWSQFDHSLSSTSTNNDSSNLLIKTSSSSNSLSILNDNKYKNEKKETVVNVEKQEINDEEVKLKKEIEESCEMLALIFPNIERNVINHYLHQYENNVEFVSDFLLNLNPLNIDGLAIQNDKNDTNRAMPLSNNQKNEETTNDPIKSNEEQSNKAKSSDKLFKSKSDNVILLSPNSFSSSSDDFSSQNDIDSESCASDDIEPIIDLKFDKNFLAKLIFLFGENDDELYVEDLNTVALDFKMAYNIFNCWKKSRNFKEKPEKRNDSSCDVQFFIDEIKQIDEDEKLSKQLFDELNSRDPLEQVPAFFSENGLNPAQSSLRQIMAEQQAEERKLEKLRKNGIIVKNADSFNNYMKPNFYKKQQGSPPNSDPKNMANTIKLKRLNEKYENYVDKQMLEQKLKDFNYDFKETCDYINRHFDLEHVKDPENVFCIKNKSKETNNLANELGNNLNYYNRFNNGGDLVSEEYIQEDYQVRDEAVKFMQLKKMYNEKANEYYQKGWGSVAYYYSEMARTCTEDMAKSNQIASLKIFKSNNPDITRSNMLDLHGLHVKEAIEVFKQTYEKKKNELLSHKSKRKNVKTYLFVITGRGQHSLNGPKLSPAILNYLKTNKIKYEETHPGFLKVDVLNLTSS